MLGGDVVLEGSGVDSDFLTDAGSLTVEFLISGETFASGGVAAATFGGGGE